MFLGIDPGASGAIALVNSHGSLEVVADMPTAGGSVLPATVADILDPIDGCGQSGAVAWVEKAQAMPRQGVSSTFKYGTGYGVLLGVLAAHRIPTHHITPSVWKKAMGVTSDKDTARRVACDLWPTHAHMFSRKKDHGRAEAALIAEYGRRQENQS